MSQLYPCVGPARNLTLDGVKAGDEAVFGSVEQPVETTQTVLMRILSTNSVSERRRIANELVNGQLRDTCREVHLAHGESGGLSGWFYAFCKRGIDIVVSSLLLIALFPLFTVVAIAICLDSGFPILYFQTRVGRNGKRIRFYKFRSMVRNADEIKSELTDLNEAAGPIFKIREDPRVTSVGRFLRRYSIDEMPQLFNVFIGDISLIGPRPLVVPEATSCDERQGMRHCVKPGLFCLREISGRSDLSFTEWMELDLLYLSGRSFSTDFRIFLRGIPVVLRAQGSC